MSKGQTSMSGDEGEDTVMYPLIILIFGIIIFLAFVLMNTSRSATITVPEEFGDGRDLLAVYNCGIPKWEKLDETWLDSCFSPSSFGEARAYRFSFSINGQAREFTTKNWNTKNTAFRVSHPILVYIEKDGKRQEGRLVTEAQNANII